ncbi:MAG: signal peptidase II [Candidatus Margulisiibacteriota bacterium]
MSSTINPSRKIWGSIKKATARVWNKFPLPAKIASSVLPLDQLSKTAATHYLPKGKQICLIEDTLSLKYVLNEKGTWGSDFRPDFLKDIISSNSFEIGLSTIYLGIITLLYYKAKTKLEKFFLSLASAGLMGNLIDRFVNSGVIDFIKIGPWPPGNLADGFGIAGLMGFTLSYILRDPNHKV